MLTIKTKQYMGIENVGDNSVVKYSRGGVVSETDRTAEQAQFYFQRILSNNKKDVENGIIYLQRLMDKINSWEKFRGDNADKTSRINKEIDTIIGKMLSALENAITEVQDAWDDTLIKFDKYRGK
jgi:hypothetical protein